MPDAWAYYLTLPILDVDSLYDVLGSVRAVAAYVLTYAAAEAEREAAGSASGGIDIKLGSLAIKESAAVSTVGTQAAGWRLRARAYQSGPAVRRTPGFVSAPVEPA